MTKAIWIAVFLMIGGIIAVVGGCDIGDVVKVDTPVIVQQNHGHPAKMSLNESIDAYDAWTAEVKLEGQQWRRQIEEGEEVAAFIGNITLQAVNDLGPTVAGIPVYGGILSAGLGIVGLFVRRPGDVSAKAVTKEKEASFNKGQQIAAGIASIALKDKTDG